MSTVDRLVALVQRDLGASNVRVVRATIPPPGAPTLDLVPPTTGSPPPPEAGPSAPDHSTPQGKPPPSHWTHPTPAPTTLRAQIPGDRAIIVVFHTPPDDVDALQRRLEMLVESFRDVLGGPASTPPPTGRSGYVARSLQDELRALAGRAGAVDAMVIDARSPIVWGAADGVDGGPVQEEEAASIDNVIPMDPLDRARRGRSDSDPPSQPQPSGQLRPRASQRAITLVRDLPAIAALHKGGHLHHSASAEDFGYIARSFAGIYVLILVFEEKFDELTAERALHHAMPLIERLVMALPPLDPSPMSGSAAKRRR